jgi:hypothetical protein
MLLHVAAGCYMQAHKVLGNNWSGENSWKQLELLK